MSGHMYIRNFGSGILANGMKETLEQAPFFKDDAGNGYIFLRRKLRFDSDTDNLGEGKGGLKN
jgi:hypothetical protein